MPAVRADLSVSLDGFVAGPDDGPEQPLGRGGEQLHEWIFGLASWRERHGQEGGETPPPGEGADLVEEAFRGVGAVVMGRRMFDLGEPRWGEEPPFRMPVFVVTHRGGPPLERAGGTTYRFMTDGLEAALAAAREAAGGDDVSVASASVVRQALAAGLLDELSLHVVPVLLGAGVRLFEGEAPPVELEQTRVLDARGVAHLRYRIARERPGARPRVP